MPTGVASSTPSSAIAAVEVVVVTRAVFRNTPHVAAGHREWGRVAFLGWYGMGDRGAGLHGWCR